MHKCKGDVKMTKAKRVFYILEQIFVFSGAASVIYKLNGDLLSQILVGYLVIRAFAFYKAR